MLLLTLLNFAPGACYKGPWCASQSFFLDLRPVLLHAIFFARQLAGVLVQGALLRHPKSVAGAVADAVTGPPYLRPSNLLLGALVRLPKLVPKPAPCVAACKFFCTPIGLRLGAAGPPAPSYISCWSWS